jgi:integrase
MPRLPRGQNPTLRRRPDGLAVVTLSGEDHYLGSWGPDPDEPSPEARHRYDETVARWLLRGRKPRPRKAPCPTIATLCARFREHATWAYRKRGKATEHARRLCRAADRLESLFGSVPIDEFDADAFRAIRESWVEARRGGSKPKRPGLSETPRHPQNSRTTVNTMAQQVRAIFAWGFDEKIVPATVIAEINAVRGLRRRRTEARETEDVRPVPEPDLATVLAVANRTTADMIRVQLLTGMRPAEICAIEARYLDRSESIWTYTVPEHANKMDHEGRERTVAIGPKAQAILAQYLLRRPRGPLFLGKTRLPVNPTQYRGNIADCCQRAGIARWGPGRLRHNHATEVRRRYGLEAAQVALGHAKADVTQVYAERDGALARRVAMELG